MGKKNNNSGENTKTNTHENTKPASSEVEVEVIPDEFKKVICDFINEFGLTFPEYSEKLDKYSSLDVSSAGRRILTD